MSAREQKIPMAAEETTTSEEYLFSLPWNMLTVTEGFTSAGEKRYITKVFGMDIMVPILVFCGIILYFPGCSGIVVLIFWGFLLLRPVQESTSEKRGMNNLRKSLISLTRTDRAESWVEGDGERDEGAQGIQNRARSISDTGLRIRKPSSGNSKTNVKYESDDGEIQSVMGGF